MKKEEITCSRCGAKCKEMINSRPTWFGKYCRDKLIEVICIDCWEKGEKWEKKDK